MITFSQPGERTDDGLGFHVSLAPHGEWELDLQFAPGLNAAEAEAAVAALPAEGRRVEASLSAWRQTVPKLTTSESLLQRSYDRAIDDLAALRLRASDNGELIAAGLPWFMTVFGRDTIIASLQTLLLGQDLARTALRELARLQATEDDASIDAEPGKIVHELRSGKGASAFFARYYGTVDATPLFLVLLSEVWRWTRDDEFARELREPALLALAWIDDWGDSDGDGFVEYERRVAHGLENQTWKDSHDSQLFHDGTQARGPIAAAEVQGYVYDAKQRLAELARDVWGDEALADRLEREAAELRRRFDEAFWCERPGGWTYALALDGEKRPVNSLTSNVGHLLWSGIVPEERVDTLVQQLFGPTLWSGWGVRTMASDDAGYNPLAYHDGTVWPHDNSLIAWGLARYGRQEEALRIMLVDARGGVVLRLPAAGGVRRLLARRRSTSDRLSDRVQATGLGGRDDRPPPTASRRDRARRERAPARLDLQRPAGPARHTATRGHPGAGDDVDRRGRGRRGDRSGRTRRRAGRSSGGRRARAAASRSESPSRSPASAFSSSSAPRLPLSNSGWRTVVRPT